MEDRFWSSAGGPVYRTATGLNVTADQALQVSCIFQGVRLISEVCGALPFDLWKEREDGGFDREKDPFIGGIFDDRANPWQTPQEWRETMTAQAILWPQAISEKKVGENGLELHPIDPSFINQTEQLSNGTLRWKIQEPGVAPRTLVQDEVFRLKGFGTHTFMGADLLRLARETVGLWLAQEKFGALYFGQGAKPSIFLQYPGKLPADAQVRLASSVNSSYGGLFNMHKVHVLEEGITVKEVGRSARESQLTEFRETLVHEIARWMNIPAHMFRAGDQPTFASVEQFAREFVDYTLMPWLIRWEQRVKFDLLTQRGIVARHNLDALLRGSMTERFAAYSVAIMNGIYSTNEVRIKEGTNPYPDPAMDKPARSTNQGHPVDGSPGQTAPAGPPPPPKKPKKKPADDSQARRHRDLLVRSAAERVIRKESARLQDLARKHAAKPAAWEEAVAEFYGEHGLFVAEQLHVPPAIGRRWAESQRAAVQAGGVAVIETWEPAAVDQLLALAVAA